LALWLKHKPVREEAKTIPASRVVGFYCCRCARRDQRVKHGAYVIGKLIPAIQTGTEGEYWAFGEFPTAALRKWEVLAVYPKVSP